MTDKKNYPEEIYKDIEPGDAYVILRVRKALEKAYDRGYADGQQAQGDHPLAGWSNLTEAIKAGERIDWDALDGIEARCVHPELGTLTHRLERNTQWSKHTSIGWHHNKEATWAAALNHAWGDKGRWSLWVKGELPLRKQTADQLEPGTIFEAVLTDEEDFGPVTLLRVDAGIIDTGDWQKLDVDLACIEVSRVRGTFQTPEGDA